MPSATRSARLLGREHTKIGGIAAISEGRAAIALSRGGAPKTYAHVDLNEDAAGFAYGPGGTLLVVADGHHGSDAAEAAVEHLVETSTPWLAGEVPDLDRWSELAVDAVCRANLAILEGVNLGAAADARTTLSVAWIPDDGRRIAFVSMGDSHVFRAGPRSTDELCHDPERRNCYLGRPSETRATLADRCVAGIAPLDAAQAVVLVTDGLSEPGIGVAEPSSAIAAAVAEAAAGASDLRALGVVRATTRLALSAQREQAAGDNVGCAVLWLE